MKSLIKFLSSIKLAIILIIIITIASIFGTFIPQNRSPQEYLEHYGQLSSLLQKLQITRLYSSWWFLTLLIFFSLNLIVCTVIRLGPKIRRGLSPKIAQDKTRILALQVHETVKKSISPERIPELTKEIFKKYHYRLKIQSSQQQIHFLGQKRILGLFGVDLVHLGLLIIVIGGIISGLTSFRTHLNIREKEVLPVPRADFSLRLDKFLMEYYPNGSIKDWKSTLTIIDHQQEKVTKTIEVNHPLAYQGFRFYQSSYGWDWKKPQLHIEIKKRNDPNYSHHLTLIPGEPQTAPDDLTLVATHFVPDFIITQDRKVATRSLEPHNPAAFIQVKQGNNDIFSGWIFAKFPDFSQSHSGKSSDYHFILRNVKAGMYSGIQVAKDPGTNFIWVGCILLGLGLFLAFYWPPREIWGLTEISGRQANFHLGGVARKNKDALAEEFTRLISDLRSIK